jgi:hypothetical protein
VVFEGGGDGMAAIDQIAVLIGLSFANRALVDGYDGAIAQGRLSHLHPGGNRL